MKNEILTATEILKGNEDYFKNPNPEVKHNMKLIKTVQDALFIPLIRRARQLIKN